MINLINPKSIEWYKGIFTCFRKNNQYFDKISIEKFMKNLKMLKTFDSKRAWRGNTNGMEWIILKQFI